MGIEFKKSLIVSPNTYTVQFDKKILKKDRRSSRMHIDFEK